MKRPAGWWSRLEKQVYSAAKKVFPGHWSFLLGEIAMFSFFVLVGTGLYLTFFYEADATSVRYDGAYTPLHGVEISAAFRSVLDITFERPFGLVIRQTHHWAALVFIAVILLHAARVFFTGAFRRPRRLNWTVGLTLMGLAMATGFFGFALPHDLLGGTSARIGHAFAVSIPWIGPGVAEMLFGGAFGNPDMLRRLWQLHVLVMPITIGGLLLAHLTLVWLQTHTQFRGGEASDEVVTGTAAIPGYALKTVGLAALVGGVLIAAGSLLEIAPLWINGPFDPTAATVPAQPDWYLAWVEGALRILPAADLTVWGREIPGPFLVGVALPVALFALLYAWPFLEERIVGDRGGHHLLDRPRDRPVRTAFGVALLALLTVLMAAASHDQQAAALQVPVDRMTDAYRVAVVVVPGLAAVVAYHINRARLRDERAVGEPADPASERAVADGEVSSR
jgi:ubiquinol-cytochrome c reductase cytochrome b subunit